MRYDLRRPCKGRSPCPFRNDVHPYLRASRAAEIATALLSGSTFACHATTVDEYDDEDGSSERVEVERSQMCAGAMATMLRHDPGGAQLLLLARHVGKLSQSTWDALAAPDQPVYGSLTEWVEVYRAAERADGLADIPTVVDPYTGERIEMEHCGVVGWRCGDPAGYAVGGGAVGNTEPPTCNPLTDECPSCNRLACAQCRTADGLCTSCRDGDGWDDEDDDEDEITPAVDTAPAQRVD